MEGLKKMEEKKDRKKKENYVVAEIPTQTAPIVRDMENEKDLDIFQSLAEILNKLNKLEGLL